ncbi:uncharacterized protein BDR25DRAFT_12700 [Lindgomyces ingoldianus]|uniref:Uncharacterized protein n=1 Tax=Lindgomyces ingoldianus TaxID=673940 RepID=A0ACB6R1L8_9PLEO|nr:uncharacterized protein BDR25DRAFT_12700 [Lindgomyces ingoldianus]KAF2472937.1 hypothetical protein BDR25DRAFT_12700 [Lindgomyces ingoldianus]
MDDLPLELLSMIVEELWEDSPDATGRGPRLTHPKTKSKDNLLINIRSVRLVCKAFRHAAANLFGETFFQVRWVSLSRKSLLDLAAISELPEYVRHIHTLRISTVKFDRELDNQGEALELLSKALAKLQPKLRSILFSLKCSQRSRDCQDEIKVIHIVRNALLHSEVQPARLRVYTNKPSALALPDPELQDAHMKNMESLRCLKLDFLNESTVDSEIHQNLTRGTIARYIAGMPQLQNVSIYFASEIWYRTPLNQILGKAVIKNLKSLRICGFNCRENEMMNFILRHRDTLRSLEIADFKLRNGLWRNIFTAIREKTYVEKLVFRRVWDKQEVFSLSDESFQGFTRSEIELVDWDKIATQREDSDLDLEPVELGETGMFISFPEDLLYDPEDIGDDEDVVNPIPYFAHELLHPGISGQTGEHEGSEDGTTESTETSMESHGSVINGGLEKL